MRHLKTLLLLISLLCANFVHAQKISLKKWIREEDHAAIDERAANSMAFTANLLISFHPFDLADDNDIVPEKPATKENIAIVEKQLKGTPADAGIYMKLTDLYKRLKMPEEALANSNKAGYLLNRTLEEHPDSVEAIVSLASIYLSVGRFDESMALLHRSLALKPDYQSPGLMIAMMYTFSDQFDSVYPYVKGHIDRHPDAYNGYSMLPVHYFYNMYKNMSALDPPERILNMNTDSVLAMDLLYDYWQRDKNDYRREYLYRVCYQTTLNAYLLFKSIARPGFDSKNIVFNVSEEDKTKMLASEKFFLASLNKKEGASPYFSNKVLGNMYILADKPKKAVPFIKKAIELRPVEKSSVMRNANEEYENLIAANLIMKDTAACEKVLLEKIKINPAIDPSSMDFVHLGNLYLAKKKRDQAEKMYTGALEVNYGNEEAMMGLAVIHFLKGNKKEANDYISRAYTINKDTWQIYYLSALLAVKENDAKNAYELYQIAKKLNDQEWLDKEIEDYFEVKQ